MADVLNKRNKVHHFDKETDEDMIPIFEHGVDGKPRNNKRLLPHRNWCSIRPYVPGASPPSTPDQSAYDLTPVGSPPSAANGGGGLFRRLSLSRPRGPSFRGPDGVRDRARPPISTGLLRTLSRRRGSASADEVGNPAQQKPPGFLTRTLSGSSIGGRVGGLFRRSSTTHRDDGGINGNWGTETDEETGHDEDVPRTRGGTGNPRRGVGLRGGLADYHDHDNEYQDGDDSYFTAKPASATMQNRPRGSFSDPAVMSGAAGSVGITRAGQGGSRGDVAPEADFAPKPLHRTPTTLSTKQLKNAQRLAVNLEGALEISLNVEISQRDPGGSTVPYRLVVPKLWYEYEGEDDEPKEVEKVGGIKRLLSLRKAS